MKAIRATHKTQSEQGPLRNAYWIASVIGLFSLAMTMSSCLRDQEGQRRKAPTTETTGAVATSLWKTTLTTQQLGPLEFYLRLTQDGDRLSGGSLSESLEHIRPFLDKAVAPLSPHLFAFETTRDTEEPDLFRGHLTAPWRENGFEIRLQGNEISGSVNHWLLGGGFTGKRASASGPIRDYASILESFDQVVPQKIFAPQTLSQPNYQSFRQTLGSIAAHSTDDLDLVLGFHFAWKNDPFSHFQLRRSESPAAELFASFDQMNVGYKAARVEFEQDLAILRVDTMMGNDTIEQIREAFGEIVRRRAKNLIIDLRGNGGGAFAVKPLVEHIIDSPFTTGYFLSQPWNAKHTRIPNSLEISQTKAWEGWSISSFWHAVQQQGIMKLDFQPAEPNFQGPVFVLVDQRSASATELAADAFRSSGSAVLIGETTPGEMLSQSFFDLPDGFMISLPVADYYSLKYGRIEGNGVPVDHSVESAKALEFAKSLIH